MNHRDGRIRFGSWVKIPICFVSIIIIGGLHLEARNILFLFADDQKADTISAYGNHHITTPNLDRLVAQGTSFRENYCFGSNSGAVCVPSRAMVNTGKPWTRITNDMRDVPMLPEILGDNGYQTFITGKWHNREKSLIRGFQSGKNIMVGGMSNHAEVPFVDLDADGKKLINPRTGEKMSSELFTDSLIEFLGARDKERPFYAYCAFTAPHDPRQPPKKYRRMYYRNRPPLPENYLPQHPFDNGHMNGGRDENLGPWPRTPELIREQTAEYYGLISYMDEQIGRVLNELDAQDLWDDTLVIYAADHGLAMGSHGLLGKQSVYEHSMKCPLILVGPDIPANQSRHSFTYLFDIFPTVLEFADINWPEPQVSKSLWPLIGDPEARLRDSVFLPFRNIMRSCRDGRYKIIYYPLINHHQLFDLTSDPHETVDLAHDPSLVEIKRKLTSQLESWKKLVGDNVELTSRNPKPMQIDLTGQNRSPDRWQPDWIIKKYFDAYNFDPDEEKASKGD